jgi:cyclophilin family peptidyl-prolyl cis-trans isomerase
MARYIILILLLVCSAGAHAAATLVEMDTSKGVIQIELYPDQAPLTVENFLKYAGSGFYDGVVFHRVIRGFVIQAGGYDQNFVEKDVLEPIKNEAANGLKNRRGTLAMARTYDPHSADSQFFINLRDNPTLDHRAETTSEFGYCVFGKVVKGMNIVDAIGNARTHTTGMFDDVPVEQIIIRSIKVIATE